MKNYFFILTFYLPFVLFACNNENVEHKAHDFPTFDAKSCPQTVAYLCNLLDKLANEELSDSAYYRVQFEIELVYKSIDKSLSQNYYSIEEVLHVAESLGCVI